MQALEDLRSRIRSRSEDADDSTMIWYLRDRGFNVAEAEEKLLKMLKWRKDFKPHLISRDALSQEIATRKAWVHSSYDRYKRPVVMIDAKKHLTGQFPLESSKQVCILVIEEAIS